MEKLKNSKDRSKIVQEEIIEFNKIIDGHRKLLQAIGELWTLIGIYKIFLIYFNYEKRS